MRALIAALAVSACGGDAGAGADAPGGQRAAAASQPSIRTASAPVDPCAWIPASEVESVVGPLAGSPTRVRSHENPTPQRDGAACLYHLAQQPRWGTGAIVVQVMLDGPVQFEIVGGAMAEKFARELSDGSQGAQSERTSARPDTAEGWDYATTWPPLTFFGRLGHVGVAVAAQTIEFPGEKLQALAARVRDRIPDLPFAAPRDPVLEELARAEGRVEPDPSPSGPDPCSLLTRQEAEAVLGRLTLPPYRSSKGSAFAENGGQSCSYFTGKHRVLVLSPEWTNGKMMFGMARGVGGLVSSVLPAGESPPTLEGPWDQATSGSTTGLLYFLKGDRMLDSAIARCPGMRSRSTMGPALTWCW